MKKKTAKKPAQTARPEPEAKRPPHDRGQGRPLADPDLKAVSRSITLPARLWRYLDSKKPRVTASYMIAEMVMAKLRK